MKLLNQKMGKAGDDPNPLLLVSGAFLGLYQTLLLSEVPGTSASLAKSLITEAESRAGDEAGGPWTGHVCGQLRFVNSESSTAQEVF